MFDARPDTRLSSYRAVPLPDREWERWKSTIEFQYKTKTLKDLMAFMGTEHQFWPTKQQYKGRFRHWGFDKYIKREEMDRLVKSSAVEKASNGRLITPAQKQRHLRRMSARARSDASSSPSASQSEHMDSDARSPTSQPLTPAEDYLILPNQFSPGAIDASFHSQPVHLMPVQETMASARSTQTPERYPKACASSRFSPTLNRFYSQLYRSFDQIRQQNASEITLIKQMNVCRWTTLHFAILWRLIIDAWPSAISHARYPIDNQSWKWFFETDLNLNAVFGYTQTVPATFAEHHAVILAALFTVRFWTKSSAETASIRSRSKPFCIALAGLATKRAASCLYDGANTSSRFHGDYAEEALSGLSTDQECVAVHSGLMKTIQCDLKASEFALWEDDIFQFIDHLRGKMKICAPTLRSSDACDVLQKYLPPQDCTGFGDVGSCTDQLVASFASQHCLVTDSNYQDVAMGL